MTTKLRFLVAEDRKEDLKLLENELKKEFTEIELMSVQIESDFRKGIEEFIPDLIISDYNMPNFDGMTALKIKKELIPDIPFIILTGSMNEETAVSCLKAGADDYVLKEHIKQINKAIKSALHSYEIDKERKTALEALEKSEKKFRSLVENLPIGVYQISPEGRILELNPALQKLAGFSTEDSGGFISEKTDNELNVWNFTPDVEETSEFFRIIREKGEARNVVLRIYDIKRNVFWVSISGIAIYDEAGNIERIEGTVEDITERKKTEAEILKLSTAMSQSPASEVITNLNGDIEYVNPKFTEMSGYEYSEALGKNPRILKSGKMSSNLYEELWKTISSGREWRGELLNKKKNNELYWVSASISPIKDKSGNITHYLSVEEDITEKKAKEEELIKAKEEAEKMNRLKTAFLANMSHELRTPMVAILGFSEILKEISDNGDVMEYAEMIHKGGTRLMETLNLILSLSEIEADKLEIKRETADLIKETRRIVTNFQNDAVKKNLYLEIETEEDVLVTEIDYRLFRESISNILNNAIKYTKKGGITVSIKKETRNDAPVAAIRIADTGIGIPPEMQGLIWEEYRQGSEGYSRKFEGTGLGLTITKNFICKLGGEVFVENSEPGKGSVFYVSIPLTESQSKIFTENIKTDKSESIYSQTIDEKNILPLVLYVEDDPSSIAFVEIILKNICRIDTASKMNKCIELAKINNYAMILLDINLGRGESGLEIAEKIKELPNYEKIPIVAITAYTMPGDAENFLQKGCTHYIAKPFTKEDLRNQITQILNEKV